MLYTITPTITIKLFAATSKIRNKFSMRVYFRCCHDKQIGSFGSTFSPINLSRT